VQIVPGQVERNLGAKKETPGKPTRFSWRLLLGQENAILVTYISI
jgi:hypothetical protein